MSTRNKRWSRSASAIPPNITCWWMTSCASWTASKKRGQQKSPLSFPARAIMRMTRRSSRATRRRISSSTASGTSSSTTSRFYLEVFIDPLMLGTSGLTLFATSEGGEAGVLVEHFDLAKTNGAQEVQLKEERSWGVLLPNIGKDVERQW